MRHRFVTLILALASTIAVVSLTPIRTAGQTPTRAPKPSSPPRMPDGHPDLQGTYDLATLTPLERPAGAKATLTAEEAAKLEKDVAARNEVAARAIKGDRDAPPKGGDGSVGAAGNGGGYNAFLRACR